ncbi:MAG TPA: GAF domain-containing protein, partial [Myxococcaceae bacterium]|nr:GAF domain-containing protein [Myxococcaceae bacterium]
MARAGSSEARTQDSGAPAPASEAERLALLAEASRLLADAGLAPPTLLGLLCALVVPRLGTACHVRLLSEDGKWLRSVATEHADPAARAFMQRVTSTLQRPDEGPSAEVLRTGRALLLEPRETEQLRCYVPAEQQSRVSLPATSLLVLPLRARQRLLGTLAVFRDERFAPFAPAEHFVLQELADRAGMALDLARAYEAERRARHAAEVAAERLARLQRVTEALSEAVTPEDVARVTVEEGIAAIGADQALLLLPSAEDAGRLEAAGHRGFTPELLAHFSSLPSTSALPVVEAYRTGAPVWWESQESLATALPPGLELSQPPTHAVACLPLLARGRPLGVLGFCFHTPRTFTPEERGLLVDLTRQSAQALERAQLYEDAQRAREELQAAHQRLEAIVQASPAAITLLELDGTVRLWNAAAEQIFGWRAEEVLGRINPTVPPERHEELRANLERVGRGESIIGQEMLRQRRDGRLISVSTWATAVRVEGGRLQCLT